MKLTSYETKDGDTLDLICGALFGNPHNWRPILDNNPDLPILGSYEGGIKLNVPVFELGELIVNEINLPPWKR